MSPETQESQKKYTYIQSDIGKGKGVYISTYGCQMNVNDTERMYALLDMVNYTPVTTPEEASLILVNSCSIREKPVHKVYSEVGHYRKLKEKNPELRIGVGGCVGSQEKENLIKNQPIIDFVFGTDNIDELPSLVMKSLETDLQGLRPSEKEKFVEAGFKHRAPYHVETLITNPGVAAFVNITKGCDNFCSFCVVPYTRGREKSRPLKDILEDVQKLIARGVKEVTLLGQNVNSYKSDCGADLADLLETLATQTTLLRIRFTTSHPKDFNQKLVDVMYRNQPQVCEYVHLPFQAGSSRVLSAMNRGYTRDEYREKIAMIKKAIPNVVLSTDIIVGFPGETEEEFQETLSLLEEIEFETIFAFSYSSRPMTKAARMPGHLSEEIKSERLSRLFAKHEAFAFEKAKKYEGQILDVLVENWDEQRKVLTGRSSQNKVVHIEGGTQSLVGSVVKAKITSAKPATLRGTLEGVTS